MAVTIEKLNRAMKEAKRFVDSATAAKIALIAAGESEYGTYCPKETGDVRRKSMDLTRALVDIRK